MKKLIRKIIKNIYIKRDFLHIQQSINMRIKYFLRNIYNSCWNKDNKLNYPKTLQFPITNKCNLDCIMCNIHGNDIKNEMNIDDIKRVLSNSIFCKVESVGINGGEPFILKDITSIIETILDTLPALRTLYIISNGTIPNCPDKIKEIYNLCKKHNVKFTLSFSIDGFDEMHNEMRGRPGTFQKLIHTLDIIKSNINLYCDSINFICTLTKKNIYSVNELEAFSQKYGIQITYNVATEHERLKNDIKYQYYSLFTDKEAKMLAREFLYSKFKQTHSKTYYGLFRYLKDDEPKRISNCQFLHNGITLTPTGDICYCATHSKALVNVKNSNVDIKKIYFENKLYNDEIKNTYCDKCSHYMGALTNEGYKDYMDEILKFSKRPMKG